MLVEGDDFNEPVADAARSILDGHIVLSRQLAAAAQFPAIEVLDSRSRVREQVADAEQRHAAMRITQLLAAYREKEELISVGAYQEGTDPLVDRAIRMRAAIEAFLVQAPEAGSEFEATRRGLLELAAMAEAN